MNLFNVLRFVVRHPLNRAAPVAALLRVLRWQLATRLLPFPVAVPFVNGLQLLMQRGMTGATGNFYCGLHEPHDMGFVLHFLRPGDVFFDIGANVGSYSLLAAATGVTEVHGFEPSPSTMAAYLCNIRLNGLDHTIHAHAVALGEAEGEVAFTRGADTTNHVVAAGEMPGDVETVPVRQLDAYFQPGRSAFIKMDVEGFEPVVLAGATRTLRAPGLLGLLLEDNGSNQRYPQRTPIADILREHGFMPFDYDAITRTLSPCTTLRGDGNVLFLRDREAAQQRVRAAPRFQLVNGFL